MSSLPNRFLVKAACGCEWIESRPPGLIVDPALPRVCSSCRPDVPAAVGTSPQGLAMVHVIYLPAPEPEEIPGFTEGEARTAGLPGWNIRCNRCGTFGATWTDNAVRTERPGWGALALCPPHKRELEEEHERHAAALRRLREVNYEQPLREAGKEPEPEPERSWAYSDLGHHWLEDGSGSYHDWPCDHPEEHLGPEDR